MLEPFGNVNLICFGQRLAGSLIAPKAECAVADPVALDDNALVPAMSDGGPKEGNKLNN